MERFQLSALLHTCEYADCLADALVCCHVQGRLAFIIVVVHTLAAGASKLSEAVNVTWPQQAGSRQAADTTGSARKKSVQV
jgi:phage tail protein X